MLRKDLRKDFPVARGSAAPEEIARFNAWAEEWWNPNGAFKTVHDFNRARLSVISERLPPLFTRDPEKPKPLSGFKVLDVGCGAGIVTEYLSTLGGDTLGIDAAERNIAVAEQHARTTGAPVKYRHALPEDLQDQLESFDVVLSLEVVEHVADRKLFMQSLARLVAPKGVLLIGTLNRSARSYLKAILIAEYLLRWLPRGTHSWRKFVKPIELEGDLRPFGFRKGESWGFNFNPLKMRWTVGNDVSTNYIQFFLKD